MHTFYTEKFFYNKSLTNKTSPNIPSGCQGDVRRFVTNILYIPYISNILYIPVQIWDLYGMSKDV